MKFVYHGSPAKFGVAQPSPTKRIRRNGDEVIVDYEGTSLHATKHRHIALSYMHKKRPSFQHNKKKHYFRVGRSLFNNDKTIVIRGKKNLEYSLKRLFPKTHKSYLYKFAAKNFHTTSGLGPLEVISTKKQSPIAREHITNPIAALKKAGAKFVFIDITKPIQKAAMPAKQKAAKKIDSKQRFDQFSDLYDKYRLPYNKDVLDKVIHYIGGAKGKSCLDVGAGTGILTRQLAKYDFAEVFSVEPNASMQQYSIGRDKKKQIRHLDSAKNSSEKTQLPRNSVDVIFVGTAIHWMHPAKTLKEFKHVLRPGGFLVDLTSGASGGATEDLMDLFQKHRVKMSTTRYKKGFTNYSNEFHTFVSRKKLKLTEAQFVGLEMSMSTAPEAPAYKEGLHKIFATHAKVGKVDTLHKTTALVTNILR